MRLDSLVGISIFGICTKHILILFSVWQHISLQEAAPYTELIPVLNALVISSTWSKNGTVGIHLSFVTEPLKACSCTSPATHKSQGMQFLKEYKRLTELVNLFFNLFKQIEWHYFCSLTISEQTSTFYLFVYNLQQVSASRESIKLHSLFKFLECMP